MDGAREGELAAAGESIEPIHDTDSTLSTKAEHVVEAGAGIEPANSGFADRDLTTWLPRHGFGRPNYRAHDWTVNNTARTLME